MTIVSLLRLMPLLSALTLMGCAITPMHTAAADRCNFTSYALDVENPRQGPIGAAAGGAAATLRDLVGAVEPDTGAPGPLAAAAAPGENPRPRSDAMLFLSGGSEHGAFGAGLLSAWGQNRPDHHLPAFKFVTGISTGAILSTFAFVDESQSAVEGYQILHESDLLALYVKVHDGAPTTPSYLSVLRKGALGDLDPLRQRLHRFIPQAMLERVYWQSGLSTPGIKDDDRVLLVGVVDVDTGRARALDLTQMAEQHHRAVVANDSQAAQRTWDCYINAVVASSSAPLAARPVFIDNREYIDGGARFGMFFWDIRNGAEDRSARVASAGKGSAPLDQNAEHVTHVFLIINGDQELPAECGKIDAQYCPDGEPPNTEGFHKKWSFLGTALRSEKILSNQVYRFSAESVANSVDQNGLRFHYALINDTDVSEYTYTNAVPEFGPPVAKKCSDWQKDDRAIDDPIQFEPRYMRCLISYGMSSEKAKYPWHLFDTDSLATTRAGQ